MFHAKTALDYNLYATIKKDGRLGWVGRGRAAVFDSKQDAISRIAAAAALGLNASDHYNRLFFSRHPDDYSDATLDPSLTAKAIVLQRIVSANDLVCGFELIYARNRAGQWLSTPRAKDSYSRFTWEDSFTDAKAFGSREEAIAAAGEDWDAESFALLSASAIFTKVEAPKDFAEQGVAALRAACESLDIRQELARAETERSASLATSKAPGRRL